MLNVDSDARPKCIVFHGIIAKKFQAWGRFIEAVVFITRMTIACNNRPDLLPRSYGEKLDSLQNLIADVTVARNNTQSASESTIEARSALSLV
jgi:hypothetical protein